MSDPWGLAARMRAMDDAGLMGDVDLSALRQPTDASDYREQLEGIIAAFESNLESGQEVGVRLVTFGPGEEMHLQEIGCSDPGLIRFFGHNAAGEPLELVQHISQISVLLKRVKALDPDAPRRIGFTAP